MTVLDDILSAAATPFAWRRSATFFLLRVRRRINGLVAAALARRERQTALAVLRHLNSRELRDIGLYPSQIDGGLDVAAQERSQMQREIGPARQRARSDLG